MTKSEFRKVLHAVNFIHLALTFIFMGLASFNEASSPAAVAALGVVCISLHLIDLGALMLYAPRS